MRFTPEVIALWSLGAVLTIPAVDCRAQNEYGSSPAPRSTASAAAASAPTSGLSPAELYRLTDPSSLDPGAIGKMVKLCESGNGSACHYAALLYASPKAGMLDLVKSAGYFQKGCDAGFARSCTDAGLLYLNDNTVIKRDNRRALELVKRGCGLGEMKACFLQGGLLLNNPAEPLSNSGFAHELFWRACDGGYGKACRTLAEIKAKADSPYRDLITADRLYRLACYTGEPEACKKLPSPELPPNAPQGGRQVYNGTHAAIYAMPDSVVFQVRAASTDESAAAEQEFLHSLPCEPSGRWEFQKRGLLRLGRRSIDIVTAKCSTSKRTRDFRFDIGSVMNQKP